ncbi:ligand-binding sensor domain-containing protein [Simiduia agarivorans]|uniref:ligand-binding sensor domain-containing protein n=1 Tax=Simiduia agarivorans TaxID=447471 RepID=UPI000ABC8504|nr:ligand-binding sensor domain-containing diguanylate cyclase [Simiduia agarivorans]
MESCAPVLSKSIARERRLAGLLFALLFYAGALAANPLSPSTPDSNYHFASWSLESGLPQVSVTAIARGPEGWMWLGTQNGLVRMNGVTVEVFKAPEQPALGAGWVSHLLAVDDAIWIVAQNRLVRWADGQFESMAMLDPIGEVTGLAVDAQGVIWLSGDGLWRFGPEGLQTFAGWQGQVQALTADDAIWWVSNRGVLFRADGQSVEQVAALGAEGSAPVVRELVASEGGVWIATSRGLGFWRAAGMSWLTSQPVQAMAGYQGAVWVADATGFGFWVAGRLSRHLAGEASMAAEALSLFASEDAAFWVGSRANGVRHYWRGSVVQWGAAEGLDTFSWTVLADNDRLLIGTESGVAQLHRGQISELVPAEVIPGGVAYSLAVDPMKQVWVGSREGLMRWAGGKAIQYPALNGVQVNSLIIDREHRMLAASSRGLWTLSNDGAEQLDSPLNALPVRTLFEDGAGNLWAGTEQGLWRRGPEGWHRVQHSPLGNGFIIAMTQLPDGRLVVGTYQQGVFVGDGQGQRWQLLSLDGGLPSSGAFSLIASGPWLWIGNGDGIERVAINSLDKPRPQLEVILHDQGQMPGRHWVRCCNGGGNHRVAMFDGYLWYPSLAGLVRAEMDVPRARVPVVKIDRIRKPGGTAAPGDREYLFGALEFRVPHALQYRYRVIPYSNEWRYVDDQTFAYFTNLPPGRKQFQVQARYTFGQWGPVASADDVIAPKWHETTWFRLSAVVVVLAIIYLMLQLWTRRMARREKWMQQEIAQRTQALTEANEKLAVLNERLLEISMVDALTGLHNRRFLYDQMPRLLANQRRQKFAGLDVSAIGFFLIDLDRFKSINDRFGHAKGDATLQSLAIQLKKLCRESDLLIRLGGEEFLLIQPESSEASFANVAGRINMATRLAGQEAGLEGELTASVGIAVHPIVVDGEAIDWEVALELADYCLYQVKHAGRNGYAYANCSAVLQQSIGTGQPTATDFSRWREQGFLTLTLAHHSPA